MVGNHLSSPHRDASGMRFASGLQARHFGLSHLLPGAEYAVLLLTSGQARLHSGVEAHDIAGPAIAWLRLAPDASLLHPPGSPGYVLGLTEQAVIEATADGIDAPLMRSFASKSLVIDAGGEDLRELTVAIEGVLRETANAERGSRTLISAFVRIILVAIWRMSGVEPGDVSAGQSRALLTRFRELVEIHFRDRWRIRDYAAELGVTHDRLHALCSRDLGRTPQALLHDRLNFEARRHLARAALSVKQISYALGFRDPAHFSAFFKRLNGVSPAGFRRQFRQSRPASAGAGYADWP